MMVDDYAGLHEEHCPSLHLGWKMLQVEARARIWNDVLLVLEVLSKLIPTAYPVSIALVASTSLQ